MNKHPRYINIITIILFNLEFNFRIGNPMWAIQEFKNIKEENKNAKSC